MFSLLQLKLPSPFPRLLQLKPTKNPNKILQIPHFQFQSLSSFSTTTTTMSSSWSCSKCTFLNPGSQKSTCQVCQTPFSLSSTSSSPSSQPKWACKACTFLNSYSLSNCEICDTRASLSNFQDLDSNDPDDDLSGPSSVGSVFFPLRRCNTGRFNELDDSGVKEKVDTQMGTDQFVNQSVQLSRLQNSGFNKRKIEDLLSDSVYSLDQEKVGKAKIDSESFSEEFTENTQLEEVSGVIKILSYNVWFREDLEVHKRMQAIGDLIQLHSPDIICFQEVTPGIYDIFRRSTWWKKYCCSVSYEIAASGAYFCMQLTKLPVKSFRSEKFSYSAMGRELSVGEIQVNQNKALVIATSHLESPTPGPPTWDQMNSKERVNQAKEAINILKKYQNVIFCGDMNWDDKLDGHFPYVEGWFDAWERLRPAEIGWTYDTKSNKMLTGNRLLQKRLDRFICRLTDFKITSIDMIGTDAIPGVTFSKQKKLKNKIQELVLPVFPSDHFGLLLTITSNF